MKNEQLKTVPRKSARTVVSLLAAALVCYIIVFITADIEAFGPVAPCVFAVAGLALFIIAVVFRLTRLRCPYCGKGLVPVRWSRPADIPCGKCGKRYKYTSM